MSRQGPGDGPRPSGSGRSGRPGLTRRTGRSGLVGVLSALLVLTGCSLAAPAGTVRTDPAVARSDDGGAVDGAGATQGADGPGGTSDGGGALAAPVEPSQPSPAGTRCGESEGWAIVVAQGSVTCDEAMSVIADYEDTADIAPGGAPANPEPVQGWACEPIIFAKMGYEPDTSTSWCERDGTAVMTMDALTELPAMGPIRNPTPFGAMGLGAKEAHWGFLSPSRTWYCALVDNPRPEDGLPTGAHCFSVGSGPGIPGTTADGPGGPGLATAVSLDGGNPPEAYYSGDLALNFVYEKEPPVLEYGEVLYARGGACTIDRLAGVTCTYGGRSFTVSSQGLTAR